MLILTFEIQQRIPQNEGELLLQFVDHILAEREPGKMAGRFSSEVKKLLLSSIAWEMHERGLVSAVSKRLAWDIFVTQLRELQDQGQAPPTYVAGDIWQEIQNNYLLIVEGEKAIWPHPLFQDLFVGLKLRGLCFDAMWMPNWQEINDHLSPQRAKWFDNPAFEIGITMLEIAPPEFRMTVLVAVSCYNPALVWQAYLRMEPEYKPELGSSFLLSLQRESLSSERTGNQHRNLVNTIGHFDDPTMIFPLLQEVALCCPSWEGRHQALYETWAKCRVAFSKEVVNLFRRVSETDESNRVRMTSLDFLVQLTDEETVSFLIERLLTDNFGLAEHLQQQMEQFRHNPSVLNKLHRVANSKQVAIESRRRAIWALGKFDPSDISTRDILLTIAQKEQAAELRREAVQTLRYFPSRAMVNTLKKTLNDTDQLVRLKSISSLETCEGFNITPVLIVALKDPDPDVGAATINALIEISQNKGKIVDVVEAAHSDNKLVRHRAIITLARLATNNENRISLQRPLPRRVFPHRRNWRADLTPVLSSPLAEAKNKTDTSPDDDRLPRSVSRCNVVPASG